MVDQTGLPRDQTQPSTRAEESDVAPSKQVSIQRYSGKPRIIDTPQHDFKSFGVTVGTKARNILGYSKTRRYLLLQNNGGTPIYLGFGITPEVKGVGAIEVPAGTQYEFPAGVVPNSEVNAISTGTNKLDINEGSIIQ